MTTELRLFLPLHFATVHSVSQPDMTLLVGGAGRGGVWVDVCGGLSNKKFDRAKKIVTFRSISIYGWR